MQAAALTGAVLLLVRGPLRAGAEELTCRRSGDLTRAGLWVGLYVLLAALAAALLLAGAGRLGRRLRRRAGLGARLPGHLDHGHAVPADGPLPVAGAALRHRPRLRLPPPHHHGAVLVFALLHPVAALRLLAAAMRSTTSSPGAAPWEIALGHLGHLRAGGAGHHLLAAQAAQAALRGLAPGPRPAGRRGGGARHLARRSGRPAALPPGGALALAGLDAGLGGLIAPGPAAASRWCCAAAPGRWREVRPEPGDAVTLVLEPRGPPGLPLPHRPVRLAHAGRLAPGGRPSTPSPSPPRRWPRRASS